jgi:hypothetical protein
VGEHDEAKPNELILGDDNMFGDDLDPPFGCLDCARKRGLTEPATHPPSNTARVVRAHAADGGQRMSDASADFEPPADYFDENGRLKPDSPPSRAARIVYGPGTIEEQTAKLNALIAQYPDDPGVSCYLEMLANEASGDEITLPFD